MQIDNVENRDAFVRKTKALFAFDNLRRFLLLLETSDRETLAELDEQLSVSGFSNGTVNLLRGVISHVGQNSLID